MTLQTAVPVPFTAQYERFIVASLKREAVLVSFYSQARSEITAFLLNPPVPLTASEQAFFQALHGEVARASQHALEQATTWTQFIPASFVEGALQHAPDMGFTVIHDNAVRSLSGYSLNLITQMSADMQRVVQQQIGVGLLTGATREVVSQRILATGLTNIPHWRSVEERAEVIARTELMRAYNAGNLAGIASTGAMAVRWITGNDERVCPICGPRHGQFFRIPGVTTLNDEELDPNVRKLPTVDAPPAHPRCRCTIRAAYDFGGTVTTPTPPPGGVIEQTPTPTGSPIPSPQEEFAHKLEDLRMQFPSDMSYWHDLELDDDRIRAIADKAIDRDAMNHFMQSRYAAQWEVRDLKLEEFWKAEADLRFGTLKSLERYRAAFRRNVDGSEYFKVLALDSKGMGFATLADCSYVGEIRLAVTRFGKYLKKGSGVRTAAADVSGVEEIMVHELSHALHNRFGVVITKSRQFGGYGTKAVELGGGRYGIDDAITALWKEWESIRRKSKGGIWNESLDKIDDRIRDSELRLAAYRRAQTDWDSLPIERATGREYVNGKFVDVPIDVRVVEYERGGLTVRETFRQQANLDYTIDGEERVLLRLQQTSSAASRGVEFYPTDYAKTNLREDFAESAMLFVVDPARLKKSSPLRYAFMQKLFALARDAT